MYPKRTYKKWRTSVIPKIGDLNWALIKGFIARSGTDQQVRRIVFSMVLRGVTMILGFANNLLLARWLSPALLGSSASITGLMAIHGLFSNLNQDNELIRRLRPQNPPIGYLLGRVHLARMARSAVAAAVLIAVMGAWGGLTPLQMVSGFVLLTALNCIPWWILGVRGDYTPQYVLMFVQALVTLAGILLGMRFWPTAPVGSDLVVYASAYAATNLLMAFFLLGLKSDTPQPRPAAGAPRIDRSLLLTGAMIAVYSGSDVLLAARLCTAHDAGVYRVAATIVAAVNSLWLVAQANVYPQLVHGTNGVPEWTSNRGLRLWIAGAAGLALTVGVLAVVVRLAIGARYSGVVEISLVLGLAKAVGFVDAFWGLRMNAAGMNKEVLRVVAICGGMGILLSFLLCLWCGPIGLASGFLIAEIFMLAGIFRLSPRLKLRAQQYYQSADSASPVGVQALEKTC